MNVNLKKLAESLEDCTTSTEYVRVIRRITRTQDPDAIVILASVLRIHPWARRGKRRCRG